MRCVPKREIVELAFSVGVSNISTADILEFLDTKFDASFGSSLPLRTSIKRIIGHIRRRWDDVHRIKEFF